MGMDSEHISSTAILLLSPSRKFVYPRLQSSGDHKMVPLLKELYGRFMLECKYTNKKGQKRKQLGIIKCYIFGLEIPLSRTYAIIVGSKK